MTRTNGMVVSVALTLTSAAVVVGQRGYPRDPFVSPLASMPGSTGDAAPRADGLAGLDAAEAVVTGLLMCGRDTLAILARPDGATYIARRGDRLRDATVERIDGGGVVFTLLIRDGRGQPTFHEVRLRPVAARGGRR